MVILVITFQLDGVSDAEYRALAESAAPLFTTVPGLISKIFLADEASNTYGGVYLFADRDAIAAYLQSEIVTGMQANPALANINAAVYDAIDAATAITQGPFAFAPTAAIA